MSSLRILPLLLLAVACSGDSAPPIESGDSQAPYSEALEIEDARARTSRPPHSNSAAFMTLINNGNRRFGDSRCKNTTRKSCRAAHHAARRWQDENAPR